MCYSVPIILAHKAKSGAFVSRFGCKQKMWKGTKVRGSLINSSPSTTFAYTFEFDDDVPRVFATPHNFIPSLNCSGICAQAGTKRGIKVT
jgi:hypothetical protein